MPSSTTYGCRSLAEVLLPCSAGTLSVVDALNSRAWRPSVVPMGRSQASLSHRASFFFRLTLAASASADVLRFVKEQRRCFEAVTIIIEKRACVVACGSYLTYLPSAVGSTSPTRVCGTRTAPTASADVGRHSPWGGIGFTVRLVYSCFCFVLAVKQGHTTPHTTHTTNDTTTRVWGLCVFLLSSCGAHTGSTQLSPRSLTCDSVTTSESSTY